MSSISGVKRPDRVQMYRRSAGSQDQADFLQMVAFFTSMIGVFMKVTHSSDSPMPFDIGYLAILMWIVFLWDFSWVLALGNRPLVWLRGFSCYFGPLMTLLWGSCETVSFEILNVSLEPKPLNVFGIQWLRGSRSNGFCGWVCSSWFRQLSTSKTLLNTSRSSWTSRINTLSWEVISDVLNGWTGWSWLGLCPSTSSGSIVLKTKKTLRPSPNKPRTILRLGIMLGWTQNNDRISTKSISCVFPLLNQSVECRNRRNSDASWFSEL